MTDYVELSKQLISITANSCLLKALNILADYGTIYTVYEDASGVTLSKYLMKHGGSLDWDETENLFLPLLYTVKLLNSNGVVHRGISPDTILVTEHHELKLKGVCTSAVRAINSEIKPELFAGYTAPEQYEKCASHGEWTDVYSICAVLYKVLTGSMPPRADAQSGGSSLIMPIQLNPSIPRSVSDAVARGLHRRKEQRTRSVTDLISELYTTAPSFSVRPQRILDEEDDEVKQYEVERRMTRPRKKFRMPVWLVVLLITLPIMLVGLFLIYQLVLSPMDERASNTSSMGIASIPDSSLDSRPDSSEAEPPPSSQEPVKNTVSVDNFQGKYFDDLLKSSTYKDILTFVKKEEVYSEEYAIGQVVSQSIEKNTAVEEGTEIELTVSKGPQLVQLPPLTDDNGSPIILEVYQEYLEKNGVTVQVEQEDNPDYRTGEIIRLSHEPMTLFDREKESTVTIYVAQ